MINIIKKFIRDELRYCYIKWLEQKKSELEYDIKSLEKVQDRNDVFWIELNDKQKLHCKIEYKLMIKKEEWNI